MHKHIYGAGAIRGQQTFRYCTVDECSSMLMYYGTNSKPEVRIDPDANYYKEMARNVNRLRDC